MPQIGSGAIGISGINGPWEQVSGLEVGGKPVYSRYTYGATTYLWHETDYSHMYGHIHSAWVIGYDYNENLYWGWKWGDNLFDYRDDGINGWYYWTGSMWKWHNPEPTVTCSGNTGASITISEGGLGETRPNGTAFGTDTIPPFPDDATPSPFPSLFVGGAFGAVVIVGAAIAVLVKRSKQATKPAASTHGGAHHVAELSPTDIAVAVADVIPAETESAEAVEVVEEAAPKESGTMSAEE